MAMHGEEVQQGANKRPAQSPRAPFVHRQWRCCRLRLDPSACLLPVLLQPASIGCYALFGARSMPRVHLLALQQVRGIAVW